MALARGSPHRNFWLRIESQLEWIYGGSNEKCTYGYASGNSAYPGFMVQNAKTKKGWIRGPYILVSACTGGKE